MSVYDVTGIGNAMVDILSPCEEQFLTDYTIEKGSMTLIDSDRATQLYEAQKHSTQVSGGSASNTMAGIASFGGKGAYIGLVANDPLGDVFDKDLRSLGLTFNTPRYLGDKETARCFIFITPDSERSMNTFLGACTELSVKHIDSVLISNSKVTYMEGYLFDKDPAKEAYYKAGSIARDAGKEIALTLSDSFCVNRHKDDFLHLVENDVDILFGNEPELCALYDTDNIDDAFKIASEKCKIIVSTRGANGALISLNGETTTVPPVPNVVVQDLTGAGDQFAAGFLYGYTKGFDMTKSGEFAAKAAAEVISHIGPRPNMDYKDFV